MSDRTKIEWADATFNPWEGCTKVSEGCRHCYAETRANRFGTVQWGRGQPRRRTSTANWRKPLKWNADAEKTGSRPRVFCASLADVFDPEVPASWLSDLLELITATQHLDWLLLTKRPLGILDRVEEAFRSTGLGRQSWGPWFHGYPPPNVWLGTTVESQDVAKPRLDALLRIPARVRFVSVEPMLGPVDLRPWLGPVDLRPWLGSISWVICGGESGRDARPMQTAWAHDLRDQCVDAGVPFLFKQWGQHNDQLVSIGKANAGRVLDGRTWDEFPRSLQGDSRRGV